MNPSAIQSNHLNRLAIVYVRQSTPMQVEHHPESRLRQYQLADRARAFGWPAQRCLVIDDDLGISGAQSNNRPGYQRLVSMVALREVGVVFGLEVSRLARNCLDWYQLLEVAAAFNVLIGDEDGLYDPGDFNDRLVPAHFQSHPAAQRALDANGEGAYRRNRARSGNGVAVWATRV